jgi:hypothetical protein
MVVSMALLAGCAATPDVAPDASAPKTAAMSKCRNADAPTGSSITRRDCAGNPDAQSVDGKELMESKRFSLPTLPAGGAGR